MVVKKVNIFLEIRTTVIGLVIMIRRQLIRKQKKTKEIVVLKKSTNFWKYEKFNLKKTDEKTTNSIKQDFSIFGSSIEPTTRG